MSPPLTKAQQRMFDYITEHSRLHGRGPNLSEAARALGYYDAAGVNRVAEVLIAKGYITRYMRAKREGSFLEPAKEEQKTIVTVTISRHGVLENIDAPEHVTVNVVRQS